MKTFSIRSMLVVTLILALVVVFFFAPFTFEYPVVNRKPPREKDSLFMYIETDTDPLHRARFDLEPEEKIFLGVEVDEYQLTGSKTHVILKMTLLEYILLERKNPFFELNPDQPTCCYW